MHLDYIDSTSTFWRQLFKNTVWATLRSREPTRAGHTLYLRTLGGANGFGSLHPCVCIALHDTHIWPRAESIMLRLLVPCNNSTDMSFPWSIRCSITEDRMIGP